MPIKTFLSLILLLLTISSCKNDEITEEVKKYCSCLEKNQNNPIGREDCLIIMEEIKEKYGNDDAAMMQVLEETDNCF
jgi:hypothetical protein